MIMTLMIFVFFENLYLWIVLLFPLHLRMQLFHTNAMFLSEARCQAFFPFLWRGARGGGSELQDWYNGKDKSGQDGTIINVQWSRPDQQIWKTVKLSLFAAQLNNTPSLQNTIEIKILIFSLSLLIIERNNRKQQRKC